MTHPLINSATGKAHHVLRRMRNNNESRSATYSHCGLYRFDLSIRFNDVRTSDVVQFIGLNPSTATEEVDDPTVRRCKRFARDWGFGGMVMTNAFAFRSTDPRPLYSLADPIGAANDEYLVHWATHHTVQKVVLCYGNHGYLNGRHDRVLGMMWEKAPRERLFCLGVTNLGCPKHPLYLAANTQLCGIEILDPKEGGAL